MGAERGRSAGGFDLPQESWGGGGEAGDGGESGWVRPERQGGTGPCTVSPWMRTYAKPWEEDEAPGRG